MNRCEIAILRFLVVLSGSGYLASVAAFSSFAPSSHVRAFSASADDGIPDADGVVIESESGGTVPLSDSKDVLRDRVLETAERIREGYGTFVVNSDARRELVDAVEALEEGSSAMATEDAIVGDWTLVCTTTTSSPSKESRGDPSQPWPLPLPFPQGGIMDDVRDDGNRFVSIVQRVRRAADADGDGSGAPAVNRVDNVIEYEPPGSIGDLAGASRALDALPLPDAARAFLVDNARLNPLGVTRSRIVLKHDAEVVSADPLRTELDLSGVILNVAGESRFLEADGDDVLGVNIPQLPSGNGGSFDTTYVDDVLRISRGKADGVSTRDQLRVFVRKSTSA